MRSSPYFVPRRFRFLVLLVVYFLGCAGLRANNNERQWILADGEKFRAELVRYDEVAAKVFLRFGDDGEAREFAIDRFGVTDRAWLAEWAEVEDDLNALVATLGGKFSHLVATGEYTTDLFVYEPSSTLAPGAPPPPALILFDAGGKAARYVKSHIEAAEKSGLVLVGCGQQANTRDDKKDAIMVARFREAFPQILTRVRLDPARVFMGGTSGGASRAYHYTAKFPHPWAGVYANGGWLNGREYYTLPFPSGMRVAMVNGSLDAPANSWAEPDGAVLKGVGCTVGVFVFEGGHQIPPPLHQHIAFEWLLGRDPDVRAAP